MGWEVERHSSEVLALTANSFWNLGVAGCYIVIEPDSELDSEAQRCQVAPVRRSRKIRLILSVHIHICD